MSQLFLLTKVNSEFPQRSTFIHHLYSNVPEQCLSTVCISVERLKFLLRVSKLYINDNIELSIGLGFVNSVLKINSLLHL